jgi:hypothetical protein
MLGLIEKSRDPNFPTGRDGLIAVDKVGNRMLFLDPVTFESLEVLNGFAPRVHELAISPDHSRAFAPIYGDGIHGHNPNPGHLIGIRDVGHFRRVDYPIWATVGSMRSVDGGDRR